jgi:hypothetical protein
MKAFRFLLLTAVILLGLSSCDFYPVSVNIYVADEAGHDRLDPYSSYFIGENITAVYEGQTYPLQIMFAYEGATKAYNAQLFGLQWRRDREFGYYLCFGEFDGAKDQDVSVTFIWPDGTSDTVHTTHTRFTPLAIVNTWKLNGKKVKTPITLVK